MWPKNVGTARLCGPMSSIILRTFDLVGPVVGKEKKQNRWTGGDRRCILWGHGRWPNQIALRWTVGYLQLTRDGTLYGWRGIGSIVFECTRFREALLESQSWKCRRAFKQVRSKCGCYFLRDRLLLTTLKSGTSRWEAYNRGSSSPHRTCQTWLNSDR